MGTPPSAIRLLAAKLWARAVVLLDLLVALSFVRGRQLGWSQLAMAGHHEHHAHHEGHGRHHHWLLGLLVFIVVLSILGAGGVAFQQGADLGSATGLGLAFGVLVVAVIVVLGVGILIGRHRKTITAKARREL
jgi:hypothetical protein